MEEVALGDYEEMRWDALALDVLLRVDVRYCMLVDFGTMLSLEIHSHALHPLELVYTFKVPPICDMMTFSCPTPALYA